MSELHRWRIGQRYDITGPAGHRPTRQLGSVVAAQNRGVAAGQSEVVEFVDEGVGGDGTFDEPAKAFAGVLVDDPDDLDGAAVGGGIELEVHGPDSVRSVTGGPVRGGGGSQSFAAAPLWHP